MTLPTTRRRCLQAALPAATFGALASRADLAHARTDAAPGRMPVLFVGHGNPMNALQDNEFTRALRAWGSTRSARRTFQVNRRSPCSKASRPQR